MQLLRHRQAWPGPAYSDLHNLKPADASVNSARSNKIYDTSDTRDAKYQKPGHPEAKLTSEDTDSWEPPAEVRGEVARAAFYMDLCLENFWAKVDYIFYL